MGIEAYATARISLPENGIDISLVTVENIQNIVGIGVDIVDVARIQEAVENHPFYRYSVYAPEEIDYCEGVDGILRFERYAARFAAKEAVAKAIGGMPHSTLDICIIKEDDGRPQVELKGKAKDYADRVGISAVCVSLSHIKNAAVAFSIAIRRPL